MGLNSNSLPAHVKAAVDRARAGQMVVVEDRHAEAAMEYAQPRKQPGVVELTLPYPPSMNRYWRSRTIIPKYGKPPFTSTYISAEGVAFKNAVALLLRAWGVTPMLGLVNVEITVFRPRKSGDSDNFIKPVLDALKGLAFGDDRYVKKTSCEWDDSTPHNPRAVVRVTQRAADLFGISPE